MDAALHDRPLHYDSWRRQAPGQPPGPPGEIWGVVKLWNDEKAFGFVVNEEGPGEDVFIHKNDLPDRVNHLVRGMRVVYEHLPGSMPGRARGRVVALENGYTAPSDTLHHQVVRVHSAAAVNGYAGDARHAAARRPPLAAPLLTPLLKPSCNLFISGFPRGTEEDLVKLVFGQYGKV